MGLISRVSSRTYRIFIKMADLLENDSAHANLLSETIGIDPKDVLMNIAGKTSSDDSKKIENNDNNDRDNQTMPDILSQLANSKIQKFKSNKKSKTFDVSD